MIPNIISQQGNANQNYNELLLHTQKDSYKQKDVSQQLLIKIERAKNLTHC